MLRAARRNFTSFEPSSAYLFQQIYHEIAINLLCFTAMLQLWSSNSLLLT